MATGFSFGGTAAGGTGGAAFTFGGAAAPAAAGAAAPGFTFGGAAAAAPAAGTATSGFTFGGAAAAAPAAGAGAGGFTFGGAAAAAPAAGAGGFTFGGAAAAPAPGAGAGGFTFAGSSGAGAGAAAGGAGSGFGAFAAVSPTAKSDGGFTFGKTNAGAATGAMNVPKKKNTGKLVDAHPGDGSTEEGLMDLMYKLSVADRHVHDVLQHDSDYIFQGTLRNAETGRTFTISGFDKPSTYDLGNNQDKNAPDYSIRAFRNVQRARMRELSGMIDRLLDPTDSQDCDENGQPLAQQPISLGRIEASVQRVRARLAQAQQRHAGQVARLSQKMRELEVLKSAGYALREEEVAEYEKFELLRNQIRGVHNDSDELAATVRVASASAMRAAGGGGSSDTLVLTKEAERHVQLFLQQQSVALQKLKETCERDAAHVAQMRALLHEQ